MQLNIQHSLRTYLAAATGLQVVWIYDGVKLPDVASKPYLTIEQMQNNNDLLAKGREAVETVYRFQFGLYADTASNRSRLQSVVSRIFHFDDIPLIDLTQSPADVSGYFNTNLTAEVPMAAESVDAKTTYHHMYFDVEVTEINYR